MQNTTNSVRIELKILFGQKMYESQLEFEILMKSHYAVELIWAVVYVWMLLYNIGILVCVCLFVNCKHIRQVGEKENPILFARVFDYLQNSFDIARETHPL